MSESNKQAELKANYAKVLAALAKNPSVVAAAKECRLTPRTIFRYLQDPDFQEEYQRVGRAVVDVAISELQAASSKAVQTLVRNLDCGSASAENMAAVALLTQTFKSVELRDVITRIAELDKKVSSVAGFKRA